jgi:prepilin-type N-terminal cleavage/methylation domain-containing protein
MKKPSRTQRTSGLGFTLIELMVVVAIIGVIAAIAIPKFASLVRKSNEGATKGNLGALRSAISIYYGDLEGQFPGDMASLTIGSKYMNPQIPKSRVPPYHVDTSVVTEAASTSNDGGGWLYDNIMADANLGTVWVNCTHTDTRKSVWTTY